MCKMTHVNADSIKIEGRETEMPLVPLVEPQKLMIVLEPLDREELPPPRGRNRRWGPPLRRLRHAQVRLSFGLPPQVSLKKCDSYCSQASAVKMKCYLAWAMLLWLLLRGKYVCQAFWSCLGLERWVLKMSAQEGRMLLFLVSFARAGLR